MVFECVVQKKYGEIGPLSGCEWARRARREVKRKSQSFKIIFIERYCYSIISKAVVEKKNIEKKNSKKNWRKCNLGGHSVPKLR